MIPTHKPPIPRDFETPPAPFRKQPRDDSKDEPRESQMPGMPNDVSESDSAGVALRRVHPVAGPRILDHVAVAAKPDVEAVEGVIKNRQPDAKQVPDPDDEREAGKKRNLLGICLGPAGGKRIGNKMLNQKCADRDRRRLRNAAAAAGRNAPVRLARRPRRVGCRPAVRIVLLSPRRRFLVAPKVNREPFIMLARDERSQGGDSSSAANLSKHQMKLNHQGHEAPPRKSLIS